MNIARTSSTTNLAKPPDGDPTIADLPAGARSRSATPAPVATGDRSNPTAEPNLRHAQARITPWTDPIVDRIGHDPRGWYFERYWLSVIGPTATMLMRRLADRFDREPDGFVLHLDHCAATMGLSFRQGANSPFGRALQRCVMFGLARSVTDGFVVRRWAPDVAARHLQRLPADVQAQHPSAAGWRGRIDAATLVAQLTEAGVPDPIARRAVDAARIAC